jgi:hypothetical protein
MFDFKKVSVDELLKEQPKTIKGLNPIKHEENNYSLDVNGVTIHDIRTHQIIYSKSYVMIQFLNSKNEVVANVSAFGSSELNGKIRKPDEHFYIGKGSIISETSFRMLKSILNAE